MLVSGSVSGAVSGSVSGAVSGAVSGFVSGFFSGADSGTPTTASGAPPFSFSFKVGCELDTAAMGSTAPRAKRLRIRNTLFFGEEWSHGTPVGVKTTSHITNGKVMRQPQKRARKGPRPAGEDRTPRSDSDDSQSQSGSPLHGDQAETASGSGSHDPARAAADVVPAATASTAPSGLDQPHPVLAAGSDESQTPNALALGSDAEAADDSEFGQNDHVRETVAEFMKWLKKKAQLAPELVAVFNRAHMHRETFNKMTSKDITSGLEKAFNGKDNMPLMAVQSVQRALELSKVFAANGPGGDDGTSVGGSYYKAVTTAIAANLNVRVRLGPLTQSPRPSHACPFQHPPARHPGRSVTRLATRRAGVYRHEGSKTLRGPCHSQRS